MEETTTSVATGSSMLLWLLATAVALLAAFVALGWLRLAQRAATPRGAWKGLLLGSMALGIGLCAALLLKLTSEGAAFAVGFRYTAAAGLAVGALLGSLLALAAPALRPGWPACIAAGMVAATTALGVQVGWIWAAGYRPGIVWKSEFLWVAGSTQVIGLVAAFVLAGSMAARAGSQRFGWRAAAGVLAGLTLVAGQELVVAGADLGKQVGTVYQHQLQASMLTLVCGAVVPLLLLIMGADLLMRREGTRHRHRDAGAALSEDRPRRRKKRHRVRSM